MPVGCARLVFGDKQDGAFPFYLPGLVKNCTLKPDGWGESDVASAASAGSFHTWILQAPSLPEMQGIKRAAVNFTASA